MTICFATNNEYKLIEVRHALAPDFNVLSLQEINCQEELPETGHTLEANAYQKANHVFEHYAMPCFADDTGLEVAALNNEPGVYSARYAGPQRNNQQNIDLLLANLKDKQNRSARFRTVICWRTEQGSWYFEGIVKGTIIEERRGKGGFGYDAVFVPEGFNQTFAEMSLEEKNQLSHRAQAVKKLVAFLKESLR